MDARRGRGEGCTTSSSGSPREQRWGRLDHPRQGRRRERNPLHHADQRAGLGATRCRVPGSHSLTVDSPLFGDRPLLAALAGPARRGRAGGVLHVGSGSRRRRSARPPPSRWAGGGCSPPARSTWNLLEPSAPTALADAPRRTGSGVAGQGGPGQPGNARRPGPGRRRHRRTRISVRTAAPWPPRHEDSPGPTAAPLPTQGDASVGPDAGPPPSTATRLAGRHRGPPRRHHSPTWPSWTTLPAAPPGGVLGATAPSWRWN